MMRKRDRQKMMTAEMTAIRKLLLLNLVTNIGLCVWSSTSESLKSVILFLLFCI